MGDSQETPRFKINPVEVAIFSIVSLIFVNSVYNLFYDHQNLQATPLTGLASAPAQVENRSPSSVSQLVQNIDIQCGSTEELQTSAIKVRLSGQLCKSPRSLSNSDSAKLIKTQIYNDANKFSATVFADISSGKFSTDYIPLNTGKNPIHIEFEYQGGKSVTQDVNILKH